MNVTIEWPTDRGVVGSPIMRLKHVPRVGETVGIGPYNAKVEAVKYTGDFSLVIVRLAVTREEPEMVAYLTNATKVRRGKPWTYSPGRRDYGW